MNYYFNLHSTMYLFQLIPTSSIRSKTLFTFHYVSISTTVPRLTALGLADLHSTMYLFQRRNDRTSINIY